MREERGGVCCLRAPSALTRHKRARECVARSAGQPGAPSRERAQLSSPPATPISRLVGLTRPRSLETPVGLMTRRPQPARSTSESETVSELHVSWVKGACRLFASGPPRGRSMADVIDLAGDDAAPPPKRLRQSDVVDLCDDDEGDAPAPPPAAMPQWKRQRGVKRILGEVLDLQRQVARGEQPQQQRARGEPRHARPEPPPRLHRRLVHSRAARAMRGGGLQSVRR